MTTPSCESGTSCGGTCFDTSSDTLHCGGCDTVCNEGDLCCGGACKSPTTTTDCGRCDNACGSGFDCTEGACSCIGRTVCDAACVDPKTDIQNCGSCNHACKTGESCIDGDCICESPKTSCADECADLRTNVRHCGKCETSCLGPGIDARCSASTCVQTCKRGTVDCNGNLSDGCEGTNPGGGSCSIFPKSCGCSGALVCIRADSTSAETCVPSGGLPLLATCSGTVAAPAPCAAGLVCVAHVCQPSCAAKADCTAADPGAFVQCRNAIDGSGKPIGGFNFCTRSCRPESPTAPDGTHLGCGPGQNCYSDSTGATGCIGNAVIGPGQACAGAGQICQPGSACVTKAGSATCKMYCRRSLGKQGCGNTVACQAFNPTEFDGSSEMGFCP